MSMNRSPEQLLRGYYLAVERENYPAAVSVFDEQVDWTHVWSWSRRSKDGRSVEVDRLRGRPAVEDWLRVVTPKANAAGLIHTVTDCVFDGTRGAMLVDVTSTIDDRRGGFLVWFTVKSGLIDRYDMRPL